MSAVASREKRKTAGQRMTTLVGKAQEEDDAFWGHETWVEDDSGNDSFRESDEDSELRKDQFDSDFDDSESDNENEEAAAGEEEEREIQKGERRSKKSNYVDIAKGGRALLQKTKGVKGSNRAVGNGINAGIVLNLPSAVVPSGALQDSATSSTQPLTSRPVPSSSAHHHQTDATSSPPSPKKLRMTTELGVQPTLASARERRSQTRKRDSRNSKPSYSDTSSQTNKKIKSQSGSTRKSRRRQYAQEELLLEAVKETEPENQRWLLARKRVQESADQEKDAMAALRDKHRGKSVIQKYHSRRGCLITLTFPEMDAVPEILMRKNVTPVKPEPVTCAITGKPARYRDPKTNRSYYDMAAFKELRRRFNAGERIEQPAKPKPKPKKEETQHAGSNGMTEPTAPSVLQPKSPSSTGFVVDLGGGQKSPGSTRSSGRKWKPSEKMIQGHSLKRESNMITIDNIPPLKVSNAILDSAPTLPSMAPNATLDKDQSALCKIMHSDTVIVGTSENDTSTGVSSTVKKSKSNGNVEKKKETPSQSKAKVSKDQMKAVHKLPDKTTDGSTVSTAVQSVSDVPPEMKPPPKEQVYVIPGDDENGLSEPRYVTQSELIMQVISNYSRSNQLSLEPASTDNLTNTEKRANKK